MSNWKKSRSASSLQTYARLLHIALQQEKEMSMLNWLRTLLAPQRTQTQATAPEWLAGAVASAGVEHRLLRAEQRAAAFGLRLP